MSRTLVALGAALLTGASAPAIAQHSDHGGYMKDMPPTDCTFCQPSIAVQGAALFRERDAVPRASSDKATGLVRGLFEVGMPVSRLGLFSTVEFVSKDGPAPRVNYGARFWVLPRFSTFNLTLGAGGTNRRAGLGEREAHEFVVRPWAEAGAEWTIPFHEIAAYATGGTAFQGKAGGEVQLGLRHPIAPWHFHVW